MTVFKADISPTNRDTFQVKALHIPAAVAMTFDQDNLVANAGLVAPGPLTQRLGIAETRRPATPVGPRHAGEGRGSWRH